MNVLKKILAAIGGFFVKIGRWIKDTAWIQPLLIVGGIFAIIFSIPYISKWVSSWFSDSNEAVAFYNKHKVSLSDANEDKSDANALFTYMAGQAEDPEAAKKEWGEKFFVVFVQEDCKGCENIYQGFEVLEDKWNKGTFYKEGSNEEFKMYSIFIDTEEEIDGVNKNLFKDYLFDHLDGYFENIEAVMQDSIYAKNLKDASSYKTDLATLDSTDSFATPTVFLFDPAYDKNVTDLGVSEVLFTVSGKKGESGPYPIAQTLFDCWYHQDIFGENYQG